MELAPPGPPCQIDADLPDRAGTPGLWDDSPPPPSRDATDGASDWELPAIAPSKPLLASSVLVLVGVVARLSLVSAAVGFALRDRCCCVSFEGVAALPPRFTELPGDPSDLFK